MAETPEKSESLNSKKITLKTSDGELFDVEEDVAMEFGTVKGYFIDDNVSRDTVVPLPNVSSDALVKVINYCKKHLEFRSKSDADAASGTREELKAFDEEFVENEGANEIKELILVANYLDVKCLLDLLTQTMADRILNKSVEYVRDFFNIENDFTPEEESALREKYAWTFEGVE